MTQKQLFDVIKQKTHLQYIFGFDFALMDYAIEHPEQALCELQKHPGDLWMIGIYKQSEINPHHEVASMFNDFQAKNMHLWEEGERKYSEIQRNQSQPDKPIDVEPDKPIDVEHDKQATAFLKSLAITAGPVDRRMLAKYRKWNGRTFAPQTVQDVRENLKLILKPSPILSQLPDEMVVPPVEPPVQLSDVVSYFEKLKNLELTINLNPTKAATRLACKFIMRRSWKDLLSLDMDLMNYMDTVDI